VGDEQNGAALLFGPVGHGVHHVTTGFLVQGNGGFVGQYGFGMADQDAGDPIVDGLVNRLWHAGEIRVSHHRL